MPFGSPATLTVTTSRPPTSTANRCTWKIGVSLSSVFWALVSKSTAGSGGPAATKCTAEVSTGSRMGAPFGGGGTSAPHLRIGTEHPGTGREIRGRAPSDPDGHERAQRISPTRRRSDPSPSRHRAPPASAVDPKRLASQASPTAVARPQHGGLGRSFSTSFEAPTGGFAAARHTGVTAVGHWPNRDVAPRQHVSEIRRSCP